MMAVGGKEGREERSGLLVVYVLFCSVLRLLHSSPFPERF